MPPARCLLPRILIAGALCLLAWPLPRAGAAVDFEKEILPILDQNCFKCHSAKAKKPKGGIRLDDVAAIRAKSRTDNLVFPRKPEKSRLFSSITLPEGDEDVMPPADSGKPLPAAQVALIKQWISEGAHFGEWKSAAAKPKASAAEAPEAINPADVAATAKRIDQLVEAGLSKAGHKPNAPVAESLWCRRVYLDLIGRIPTYEEMEAFLQTSDKAKRSKLIDTLLASNGHVSTMFNYWCDALRARDELADNVRGEFYLHYLKESIRRNKPYDAWVRELLAPDGNFESTPAAGYYLRDLGNRFASVDNTASIFLGTQIGCAQCHDHPYDEWSRKSYHEFAAWTSAISIERRQRERDTALSDNALDDVRKKLEEMAAKRTSSERRQVENAMLVRTFDALIRPMTGRNRDMADFSVHNGAKADGRLPADYKYPDGQPNQPVTPAVLFGSTSLKQGQRPADTFAAWVTAPENPRFALTIANRMWARMFGAPFTGSVDAVQAIEDSSNPALSAYLSRLMVATKFDLRQFQRILANTQTYARQAGSLAGPGAVYDFPGPLLRRMSAEQVWDSLMTLAVADLDKQISFAAPAGSASRTPLPSDTDKIIEKVRADAKEAAKEELHEMHMHRPAKKDPFEASPEFSAAQLKRASELPQPAPESHFLRVFGQSNREVADAGWRSGTVPQTLLMLNSTLFDLFLRKGAPFYSAMKSNTGDSARLHAVYLSILGRLPTMEEMRLITSNMGGTGNAEAIAHTLLGTRQFLFIQ